MSGIGINEGYRVVVGLHIAAGVFALAAFWTAGFARKRKGLHTKAGAVYLVAMRVIVATGAPMAAMAFVRGQPAKGTFLLYLVALVATTVHVAPRAVRFKTDFDAFRSGGYRVLAHALPLAALAAFAMGIAVGAPVLWGFSLVGFFVAFGMHRTLHAVRAEPGWWLRQHYSAMIGNGIGTHVAFFSIGLVHLLPAGYGGVAQNLPWFGPLAVGLVARALLDRRHRRRFAAARGAAARPMPRAVGGGAEAAA